MSVSISVVGNTVYIRGGEDEVRDILKRLEKVMKIRIIYEGLCG